MHGVGAAAAATDERMFSRWHAARQAQQAVPAALVNQASWMIHEFVSADDPG
jgi:hypothetical protein